MIESGRHYSTSQRDLRELITFTSFTHSEASDEVTPVTKCVKLDNEEILAELYVLQRVSGHDNFPAFYGAYYLRPSISNEEALWIAMTMCAGGSVDALIRSTPNRSLDETWISYICKKVLQGLDYLQELNVIHHDLKGANIMLTSTARVKISK
ncbi:hypothetical protein XELAEV_18003198mg [Xenopus laevis]|uniref:Protein kinase domain-containing protein n=1 Tax=Xenopus laevis TaxID=8355 RepID=A0A974BPQ2_XENLA|nr:hypothetical protein XELAEV_18003198mg [Xenopus laevis]